MEETAIYDARLELVDFAIEVFHDVPDTEFVSRLLDGSVELPEGAVDETLDAGFEALARFTDANAGRGPEAVQDDLAEEFTRVFVGPRPPVLAHETAFREDTEFIGQGLAEVEASYSAAGWNPPEEYGEENDYLAVELAFLRHLIGRQRAGVQEAVGYERVFLDEHLLTWVDDFAAAVAEETDEPLFLAGARVAAGLAHFEDELVAQIG